MTADNDYELIDNAYGKTYPNFTGQTSQVVDVSNDEQRGWYDLTLRSKSQDWERRLMGRIETGVESISDPAMAVAQTDDTIHPGIPKDLMKTPRWWED